MVQDQVDEVKSKVDLVEVISSYLPLKRAGRNFAGLCPFHSEKTPSFMVSPERQVWRCFGCSEGGDVFTFLEKIEGWEFKEVLGELAKRTGVKLTKFVSRDSDRGREKLLSINSLAAKFYNHLLLVHPAGEVARKYLLKRGIKPDLWEKFGLGYAPAGWDNALNFFEKRGFALSDLSVAGLVIARQSASYAAGYDGQARSGAVPPLRKASARQGFYDRFRERIIFPLCDSRGAVLGFSGRTLVGDAKEAKYINSPQTPIFNKGSLLFGLDLARRSIREANSAVLVEGEFDVLSAWCAGVCNVVASKGTALTEKQVVIISRLAENVDLCFDTDLAGDAAARRGIELLDLAGVNIRVVRLSKFKDPDEFAQSDPVGFGEAIKSAVNIYDYFIESASRRFDAASALGKKKIGQEILPVISKISDDIMRAHYTARLAALLDLDISLVAAAVEKKVSDFYAKAASEKPDKISSSLGLEEYFLALFILQDAPISNLISELDPSDFSGEQARNFWKWIRDIMKTSLSAHKSLAKLFLALPKGLISFVDNLYLVNVNPAFSEKEIGVLELMKVARRIKQLSFKRQMAAISEQIKFAQKNQDEKELDILAKQFDQLSKNLKEVAA